MYCDGHFAVCLWRRGRIRCQHANTDTDADTQSGANAKQQFAHGPKI
ncbi:hypothetical protein WSK_2692 [Novosphingobium sp. Rr 2-17]|nr:hypothetical protein WSK_2692 [Novosphingobium sp. Rr 2-17]